MALLKKHGVNVPLDRFDADAIDQWLAVWCKRPTGEGGPLALTTCRNTLIALRQFIRWLSRSAAFQWEMPRGYTFPRCRIDKLPADRVKRLQHFKRTELASLWQNAHPWDRAMILLALNCGFSKREIATLQKGEIVQKKDRTFIQRNRTKSDVYTEWELWPETCAFFQLDPLRTFQPLQGAVLRLCREKCNKAGQRRGGRRSPRNRPPTTLSPEISEKR